MKTSKKSMVGTPGNGYIALLVYQKTNKSFELVIDMYNDCTTHPTAIFKQKKESIDRSLQKLFIALI